MAHHDEGTTIGKYLLQGGQSTTDTGVVGYVAILVQWHVEIYTDNCLLTGKVELIDFHFVCILMIGYIICMQS